MRTPEEIKKGLECCAKDAPYPCNGCPYERTFEEEWSCKLHSDTLAYTQQLEAMAKPNEQIRWERDTAIEQLKELGVGFGEMVEVQVQKWISVDERLPEVSDVVLVVANGKPRENITLDNALLIASFWGEEGWIADGFEGWDALKVTHWMPLPEPPKEG